MTVHRTGPEGFPTPCCGLSYSEIGRRGEKHTMVEGDVTCPGKTAVMSPEHQRIEMLEARVKQLEDTILFMGNTLAMLFPNDFTGDTARQMYNVGRTYQAKIDDLEWGSDAH